MPRGRIKSSPLIAGSLSSSPQPQPSTTLPHSINADRESIIRTLDAYIQAWFQGDAAAMEQCLHPELTARMLKTEEGGGRPLDVQAFRRTQGIQALLGAQTHPMSRRSTVTVLDISGHSASARADLGDWIAYVHLAFTGERWAIVNVLWEWMTPRDRRSA